MGQTPEKVSVRDVAGQYITALGEKSGKVVVVNADLMGTSRNRGFFERFPERTFNVGIAEQNLISFSAGLAHEGFMPYAFSMAPFISMRAAEQCRTDVAYGNLNVRMIGTYAGYSAGISGATHCALEDCAIMGSMANMTVLEPGDPYQVRKMLDATLSFEGPVYIRSGIEPLTPVYPEEYPYEIGRAITAREGGDGAFIVSGVVVQFALEAAEILRRTTGREIRVVDMHTIKPIDELAVVEAARTGRVIAAQDHNRIGGLGYYAAAVIAPRLLPEPVWGGTVLGVIPASAARPLGLGDHVLAVAGGHDQPCAAIGMGVQDPSAVTVSAGSYECAARASREPLNDERGLLYGLNSYCHVLEGQYITLAFFASGMAVQWYLDTFCGEEKAAAAAAGADVHRWMEERAADRPTGVCITPHIFGSMNPEWSETASAKVTGLTAGITKADLYRAVLEGTCCELDLNLRVLEGLTGPVERLYMTGGGARSDCWMRLRADITGKEITVIEGGAEASCVGAAILAGMGLGVFTGPEDANARLRRATRTYRPEHPEAYIPQKAAYLALHREGLLDGVRI